MASTTSLSSRKRKASGTFMSAMDSDGSSRTLGSSTSTSTTSMLVGTPSTSSSGRTAFPPFGHLTFSTVPSGVLPVTTLNARSWRTAYPRIGQFAMTESEEVVAAVPDGLFCFKRVEDHSSKPWSEGRLLPNTSAGLNDSFVTGLATISIGSSDPCLYVYYVSGDVLRSFYRSRKGGSWVKDPRPPLSSYLVSGTPAVASTKDREYDSLEQWSLVVPCQSGGLLHTSTSGSLSSGFYCDEQERWEPADHVAKSLGIVSSVSIVATHHGIKFDYYSPRRTDIVMVCIAGGRLYTAEGTFIRRSSRYSSSSPGWEARAPTRIPHPGEVTGNPVLVKKNTANQLDLLVPSAEGGVFHFVRTASTPDEWHMIARIAFPRGLPSASCLAVHCRDRYEGRQFRALIQSGGRLYHVTTFEDANPWSGSYLKPIEGPGPFAG